MFSDRDWMEAIEAAQKADAERHARGCYWSRVADTQVSRLLSGAIEHLVDKGLISTASLPKRPAEG